MSVLAKIRGELLSNISVTDKTQRKALIALYDAIDSDLDMRYTMSSVTEDALDDYNKAIISLDTEDDEAPLINDAPITTNKNEVEVKERNLENEDVG